VTRLVPQLLALESVLLSTTTPRPIAPAVAGDVYALIRGIKRKAGFAQMHMAFLAGIRWEEIDQVGRRPPGGNDRACLRIPLSEATIVIEHPTAVIDHIYMAFDGLTAALVNMTDTLGRLVNTAYSLGIDHRRASLLAVKAECTTTSSLGIVLNDGDYTDWLRKVRDLRGRCQHADVEDILITRTAPLGRREQPDVDVAYSWKTPAASTPLVAYSKEAMEAADVCLDAAIAAILANPGSPMR
jgi:hypothetical protein